MKRLRIVLFALAVAWTAALLHRGFPIAWDEVEFFRATKWIGEGRLPFRDFWEHHLPLQWYLFAPIARLFSSGPGVDSIVVLRWAQIPLWIAAFALLNALARRVGLDATTRWMAMLMLVVSTTFVNKAVEYRVDVVGNLAYIAAVALIARAASTRHWIAFGAVMSAAVLSNMRLAPLVVITAGIVAFWRAEERRWRFDARALWMIAGVAAVAALFLAHLAATGSMEEFVDGAIRYNVAPAREKIDADTFFITGLSPFRRFDLAGIAYWVGGAAGTVLALRDIRRPGTLQILAILVIASLATIAIPELQYEYHFQTPMLLLLPLVAWTIAMREPVLRVSAIVAAGALLVGVVRTAPGFGEQMWYQNRIMRDVDRVTAPNETVFDGVGWAVRRESPYRYWFLPTGVRMLAAEGSLPPYDFEQIVADPPAAIIFGVRVFRWVQAFPRVGAYATRHYVPLHRDLWIPGMSAIVEPRRRRFAWRVPRSGRYVVWTSELLAKHPWLTRPLEYAATTGPTAVGYEIPLDRLPKNEADLQWIVDGVTRPQGGRVLALRKGARLELIGSARRRVGLMLVPQGIESLCMAPEGDFVF